MTEQARAAVMRGVPWRRGLAWWVVGIEGLILLAIGIYIVADPDTARDIVRQLIGAFLLVNSAAWAYNGLRSENQATPITPYRMLAAGVGFTAGLLVFLEPISDLVDGDAAKVILAVGLLGCGAIILAGSFATKSAGGLSRGPLIASALYLIFGALVLFNARRDSLDPRWFGYAAIVCGVLACGYAYALYRTAGQATAGGGAAEAGAPTNTAAPSSASASTAGHVASATAAPADATPPVAPIGTVIPPSDDSVAPRHS
jgi:uncharacterized membrane protein HdeD (DUF308 family)